jgi:paired amphipathic helix protein Sin3a
MTAGGRGGPPQQQQQMMQAQNKQAQMQQQQPPQQPPQPPGQSQQQQQQGAAATRTIEFDHAIMYVTNIKKRFADKPRIYHTFLEILHTYQKEQRGIKEVLEQVSSLFADHPDLLREFTFFLPDAVQEQAKERLSRAAAEAEAKQRAAAVEAAAKQAQAQQQQAQAESGKKGAPTGWRSTPKGKAGQVVSAQPPAPSGAISGAKKFIDMTQPEEAGLDSPSRRPASGTNGSAPQTQETFNYNAGVERQFFDAVKAALTSFSRDGQAYAEFIKTLDMYAQEILSRADMLGYVERLLGKHKDLFEEFKRIINAVGSPDAPAHDDSWHSVPLSEIDFSRCRRCSPSYRALPRDYPNPPCSDRSKEEVAVLNDVWVSLPLGSEENNTFRHMRKNQYEETLFRCEDMRFEIDMCIDSNAATLQRLTKIYDELQFLSEHELLLTKGSLIKKSLVLDGAGMGGKIYQYTLDGRVLGVIHKLAIKRIYGEDGNEMLDLCFKNPAVALPIVVKRLRQKDEEFRAAREVLNRKWKDLGEHNYYKSLDHRSITWRTTDKRATSTRTMVAEIKDRAAHDGFEGEAAVNARMEKAKEEHGTFYEITMAGAVPRKMDLTDLPKPTETIFTPHMSFMYDNNCWAQQDAYRVISFALERGSISPTDKEACFGLWRDFFGPWFGLSLSWMQSPAALFKASPPLEDETPTDNGDDSGNEEDTSSVEESNVEAGTNGNIVKEEIMKPESTADADNSYFSSTNHIPFPPETLVSTTFGEGKVVQYLQDDGLYEVSYVSSDESTAYLRPDSVFGSVTPVEPSLLTDQLRTNDQEVPERPDDQLIIGPQCLYLFFRLHQVLVQRLNVAKKLAVDVSKDTALGRHTEKLTFEGDPNEGAKRYEAFLGLVYSLIDAGTGSSEASEGGKYEDRVRYLLGNNAYELTTMDKLISHILKHLQNMANDDTFQNMVEIYRRHELAGNFKPSAFREEAALMSEGENMFAFQICNVPKTDQKISHCEFLGCIAEDVEDEEEDAGMENDDNKRGIDDVAMEDTEEDQASKRPRRAS